MKSLRTKHILAILMSICLVFACSSSDEDEALCNSICQNGGICIDGSCDCPEGYTGIDCSEKLFPSLVTVKEIIITEFPENNEDEEPWDELGKPDIAVAIYDGGFQLFFSEIKQDVNFSDTTIFSCGSKFMNAAVLRSYEIPLTEWDGNDYQLIGIMEFTPYENGQNSMDTVAIKTAGIQGQLIIEYEL